MTAAIESGRSAQLFFTVGNEDTAVALGSGSLPVLATPRLVAWCEAATCSAIEDALSTGRTSVGTRVSLEHTSACEVGTKVQVDASVTHVDGRLVRFAVAATGAVAGGGRPLVASGEVTRVVVDRERFLARVATAED